jgi:sialate O-acetylesterase
MKTRFYFLIVGLISVTFLHAQKLTLNELFNEGAVLQQKSKVLVWGKSTPGNKVTVKIQGKNFQTESDASGNWSDELNSLNSGGPFVMEVISLKDTLKLNEIYVGEVWLAGGQSNMAFMLQNSDNGKEEIVIAKNKNIRFVMVPYKAFEGDKTRGDMNWRTATTENVSNISAVAYYFAKDLQSKLNVPVGIICCYKGGSGAETWMSRENLIQNPELAPIVEKYEKYFAKLGIDKYQQLIMIIRKAT